MGPRVQYRSVPPRDVSFPRSTACTACTPFEYIGLSATNNFADEPITSRLRASTPAEFGRAVPELMRGTPSQACEYCCGYASRRPISMTIYDRAALVLNSSIAPYSELHRLHVCEQ